MEALQKYIFLSFVGTYLEFLSKNFVCGYELTPVMETVLPDLWKVQLFSRSLN